MSFWRDRSVLVTGCTGFLGTWLTKSLLEREAQVVGLVRDIVPREAELLAHGGRRFTVVRGDVCDGAVIERTLGEYEVDTVFHLAAQAIVGVANRNPISTFETNVQGTWVVMEACRHSPGVSRIVVASSDKAYGVHENLPYEEDFPLQGTHPYDVSKSCADLIAAAYHRTYSTPVCITRCGNLFGGGDLNFSRIVPGTIRSALLGEQPIIRSDGSPIRDYVYVQDASNGYLLLAEAMDDPDMHGRAFNFGTGEPVSVLDLTRRILRTAGRTDLEPRVLDEVQGEIHHQYLSSGLSRKLLRWQPEAPLDERLDTTIAWYRGYMQEALV